MNLLSVPPSALSDGFMGDIGGDIGDGDRVSETFKVHFEAQIWHIPHVLKRW